MKIEDADDPDQWEDPVKVTKNLVSKKKLKIIII